MTVHYDIFDEHMAMCDVRIMASAFNQFTADPTAVTCEKCRETGRREVLINLNESMSKFAEALTSSTGKLARLGLYLDTPEVLSGLDRLRRQVSLYQKHLDRLRSE